MKCFICKRICGDALLVRLSYKSPSLTPWAQMSDLEVHAFKVTFGAYGFDVRPGDVVPLHRACHADLKAIEAEFHRLRQQST